MALEAEIGTLLTASERRRYEAAVERVHGGSRFRAAADEGRELSLERALEYALET